MNAATLLPSPARLSYAQMLRSRYSRLVEGRRKARTRRLHVEQLEMRTLLAFVVNSTRDLNDADLGANNICNTGFVIFRNGVPEQECTLRAAIQEANSPLGTPDTINFNIPTTDAGFNGQWWTITLLLSTGLPTLVDSGTTIDGFSQTVSQGDTNPGVAGSGGTVGVDQEPLPQYQKPEIAINGNAKFNAFVFGANASNITIQGMAVYNVGALAVSGATIGEPVAIQGDAGGTGVNRVVNEMFIGVLPDGNDPGLQRNKGFGARQFSNAAANGIHELEVTRSLVGYNGQVGLDGFNSNSEVIFTYNEVFRNGWNSVAHDGIDINGKNSIAKYNLTYENTSIFKLAGVGVPSGDAGNGIEVGSKSANGQNPDVLDKNVIENNTSRDNLSAGISIRKGPQGNFIRKNEIFGNTVGISVDLEEIAVDTRPTRRNELSQNSIYMNMGLGIDLQKPDGDGLPWQGFATVPFGTMLGPDGVNEPQDHCDVDSETTGNNGANDLQNFPVLTSASTTGTNTIISGTLDSLPNTTFTIEFFSTPDGTLFGTGDREGQFFIGSILVTTGQTGGTGDPCTASFNANFATAVPEDHVITSTATKDPTADNDAWSTSEFSGPITVNLVDLSGKVTGGGWYTQMATSTPPPDEPGETANFGFNAMYRKKVVNGVPVPEGNTNFVYREQNIHFKGIDYSPASLVVEGGEEEPQTARWRGTGKLNNQSGYGFEVNLTDNGEPGSMDTWRIHIWQEVDGNAFSEEQQGPASKYENGADPSLPGSEQQIDGGNLQVHIKANGLKASGTTQLSIDWGTLRESFERVLQESLSAATEYAIEQWRSAGVDEAQLSALSQTQVQSGDLPEGLLGLVTPGRITVDVNAAGHGWFVDATPHDSSEFHAVGHDVQMAFLNSPAFGRMDLLTTLTHEFGHVLGFDHSHDNDVMHAGLAPSLRLLPELEHNHELAHSESVDSHFEDPTSFSFAVSMTSTTIGGLDVANRLRSLEINVAASRDIGSTTVGTPRATQNDAADRLFQDKADWRLSLGQERRLSALASDLDDELLRRKKSLTWLQLDAEPLERLVVEMMTGFETPAERRPDADHNINNQQAPPAQQPTEPSIASDGWTPARIITAREAAQKEAALSADQQAVLAELGDTIHEIADAFTPDIIAVDAVFAEEAAETGE